MLTNALLQIFVRQRHIYQWVYVCDLYMYTSWQWARGLVDTCGKRTFYDYGLWVTWTTNYICCVWNSKIL